MAIPSVLSTLAITVHISVGVQHIEGNLIHLTDHWVYDTVSMLVDKCYLTVTCTSPVAPIKSMYSKENN